jgi:mono/diheme cytochrome c family protein
MNTTNPPWLISFGSLAALLLLISAQGVQAQTAEERGKQDIVTYMCYGCHGYTGDGGQTDVAPRINVDRLSVEAMMAYVRNPGGRMPPYHTEEQIPDQALRDIYAYLKSLPPSPAWQDIPLLKD